MEIEIFSCQIEDHQQERVDFVCFYKGCSHRFLCKVCLIRSHKHHIQFVELVSEVAQKLKLKDDNMQQVNIQQINNEEQTKIKQIKHSKYVNFNILQFGQNVKQSKLNEFSQINVKINDIQQDLNKCFQHKKDQILQYSSSINIILNNEMQIINERNKINKNKQQENGQNQQYPIIIKSKQDLISYMKHKEQKNEKCNNLAVSISIQNQINNNSINYDKNTIKQTPQQNLSLQKIELLKRYKPFYQKINDIQEESKQIENKQIQSQQQSLHSLDTEYLNFYQISNGFLMNERLQNTSFQLRSIQFAKQESKHLQVTHLCFITECLFAVVFKEQDQFLHLYTFLKESKNKRSQDLQLKSTLESSSINSHQYSSNIIDDMAELKQKVQIKDGARITTIINISTMKFKIAIGGGDSRIRIWNVKENKQEFILLGHKDSIIALLESTLDYLFSSSRDQEIIQWDLKIKQSYQVFKDPLFTSIQRIFLSQKQTTLVLVQERELIFYNFHERRVVEQKQFEEKIECDAVQLGVFLVKKEKSCPVIVEEGNMLSIKQYISIFKKSQEKQENGSSYSDWEKQLKKEIKEKEESRINKPELNNCIGYRENYKIEENKKKDSDEEINQFFQYLEILDDFNIIPKTNNIKTYLSQQQQQHTNKIIKFLMRCNYQNDHVLLIQDTIQNISQLFFLRSGFDAQLISSFSFQDKPLQIKVDLQGNLNFLCSEKILVLKNSVIDKLHEKE